jgi:thymidylate kinase
VRIGYLKIARGEPDRFRIIDAMKDPKTVCNDIKNILAALLH